MKELERKLEKVINVLKEKLECEAIVIFGSYVRGTNTEKSDVDIAFKTNKEIDSQEQFELVQELEEILGKDVDLVNLDKITDVFRYEILMNGKTLYCKDSFKFDMYKLDMYREYLELNESRKDIIERVKNGGTIYGK